MDKTIFNLQRFQILQTKLNPNTAHLIEDSYAYAWYRNTFPTTHDNQLHEDLEVFFSVTKQQVDTISKKADDEWRNKNYLTFYDYEAFFNVNTQPILDISRLALISTFRYFYLCNTFDQKFWSTLLANTQYPIEAGSITSKFSNSNIYLI